MSFLQLCKQRYSCRLYKNQPIEPEKLDYVLQCARLAPSAVNRQPWRLQIIETPDALAAIHQAYNRPWFTTAPIVIAVIADQNQAWIRQADRKNHADIDAAILTQYICLAATEQGLATCWVGNFDPEVAHQALHITNPEHLVALIPVGYPADSPKPKDRKPLSNIIS